MRGTLQAWLATCAVMGCFAQIMRYSDIEMLDVRTCPHLDSCRLIPPSANFSARNCECDVRCAIYKDCCIDAAAQHSTSRTRAVCMPFGSSYLGAYVVATCPRGSDRTLVDRCERDDFGDPLLSTPVTDERWRRSYLNHYCAQCNGASTRLQPWILSLECPEAENFTWADVTRTPDGWSVQGHPCELNFDQPPGLRGAPRLCRASLTDTCPPDSDLKTYAKGCKAYLAMVVGKNLVTYRNPHCALCNGNTVDDLSCFSATNLSRRRKPFSFALLLDVNRSDGDLVGITGPKKTCLKGEKYDPFFDKCRMLICGIPGYTMSDGKCVKQ